MARPFRATIAGLVELRSGDVYGRLTLAARIWRGNVSVWECACVCGKIVFVRPAHIRSGQKSSCGCLRWERLRNSRVKHQGNCRGNRTREYSSWASMNNRCFNPTNKKFPRYGARGIKVCERWKDFAMFLEDMGIRPAGTTIERIDNDGDYTPENCKWATSAEQSRNKSNSRRISYGGSSKTVTEWGEVLGIPAQLIFGRLRRGWTDERALTQPLTSKTP